MHDGVCREELVDGVEFALVPRPYRLFENPGAVAVVTFDDRDVRYTPVVATADVSWRLFFSATGDTRQLAAAESDRAVQFTSDRSRPVVAGDLAFHDETAGLVTWPTYRRHLAEAVGTTTDGALQTAVDRHTD